jgi:2-keto-4-pentenoate hydratase/2-oxohepta-3-ene-1,7-dioic acid hydratase in catechol pathway
MKIARFNAGRIGVVLEGGVVDVTEAAGVSPAEWPPVGPVKMIRDFASKRSAIEARAKEGSLIPLSEVHFETPIPWPHKLIAIPVNYEAHAIEMSSPAISRNAGFFMKSSASLIGASDEIILPDLPGREVHHEAELAVIIGTGGRNIPVSKALDHVFGYACLLDMTVRGKQERTIRKSYDTFTPVGPYITTADEVGDPTGLQVTLWVNEQVRQDANTRKMFLSVAELIEMCSSVTTLEAGDIIATGTAEGVGPVVAGDVVRISITNVGEMSLRVRQGEGGGNIAIPHHLPKAS